MARAQYEWTQDIMTYVTWSRGYQSGGYNPRPGGSTPAVVALTTRPFDEEDLFSWELGLKSRWFDDRLQLNAAGYYNEFQDQQVTTFVPGAGTTTAVANAGKSRLRGYELEIQAAPVEGLMIYVNHAWTKADYSEFIGTNPLNPAQQINFAGQRSYGHLPKRTWSGLVRYTLPPTDLGTLTLTGSFSRESQKNWLGIGLQDTKTKSQTYTKYDARIDLVDAFGMEGVSLGIVGKNLTDRKYRCCQGIDFFFWQGVGYGEPRQIFVELGYRFGEI
jgi:iron complex outermembrane receptor protein